MTLLNRQPIEKVEHDEGRFLDVHSIFDTIQGEGPFAGMPAVFVRLAGCNLQCRFCDTQYTQGRRLWSVDALVDEVSAFFDGDQHVRPRLIVVTGGEPFRQNIGPFVQMFPYIQIETNGTLPIRDIGREAHIIVSPKTGKVHHSVWMRARAAKYVLDAHHVDPEDGLPTTTLGHVANPRVARPPNGWKGEIYVQPADDDTAEANLQAAIESCMRYGYRLSLQTHKIIGLP